MINKPIPYGRHSVTQDDIDAVERVLRSDYLTQGPETGQLEEAFASYTGSTFAVSVCNGTAALHLSMLALGLEKGGRVITTPITFAASANGARYCGADIEFADIDQDTWLIDIDKVRLLLENSEKDSFDGIVPVNFSGRIINMESLRELADKYGLWIVEDACHSPGGWFTDKSGIRQSCGNGQFADVSIFSFHPVKHIAAGEGGMITTNSRELYEKLMLLRTHGISRNEEDYINRPSFARGDKRVDDPEYPGWYMEMQQLGCNYRLTDFQAALAASQLSRAEEGVAKRRQIADRYAKAFSGKPYIRRQTGWIEGHAYHLYIIEVERRYDLYNYLRENQIYSQIHYIPLHLMPYYQQLGWKEGDMPVAESYYKHCISLPIFPDLTVEEQAYVIETIDKFYES